MINPEAYRHPELKALYYLIKSEIYYKKSLCFKNDSILDIAFDFYSNSYDKLHCMKSEFFMGIFNKNGGKYGDAIIRLLKAYSLSKKQKNYLWQGLAAQELSEIFDNTSNSTESINYARIAHNCFKKAGNSSYTNLSLRNLSNAYYNKGSYDSCIILSNELLKDNRYNLSVDINYDLRKKLAVAFMKRKEYNKAIETLRSIPFPQNKSYDTQRFLGLAYIKNGMIKQGVEIIDSVIHTHPEAANDSYFNYELYSELGDTTKAYRALQEMYATPEGKFVVEDPARITATLVKFDEIQKEYYDNKLEKLFYGTMFLILIIFIYSFYKKYMDKQFVRISESARMFTNKIASIKIENSKLAESIVSLLSTQFRCVNEACQTLHEATDLEAAKKIISRNMLGLIDFLSNDKKTIDELGAMIDYHCRNLFTKFKHDFPNLNDRDYRLFLLSAVGFDNLAIAKLFGGNVKSVYGRRDRMKVKILNSDSPDRINYISILYPSGLKGKAEMEIGSPLNIYKPDIPMQFPNFK